MWYADDRTNMQTARTIAVDERDVIIVHPPTTEAFRGVSPDGLYQLVREPPVMRDSESPCRSVQRGCEFL